MVVILDDNWGYSCALRNHHIMVIQLYTGYNHGCRYTSWDLSMNGGTAKLWPCVSWETINQLGVDKGSLISQQDDG